MGEYDSELQAEAFGVFASRRIHKYAMLVIITTINEYFTQLDYSKLIIEKNIILKQ